MGKATELALVLVVLTIAVSAASGQSLAIPPGATKVDPGVGDVGAVSGVSRVDMRRDLRQQRGFGDVFRMELHQPFAQPGQRTSTFFRIDGGIAAVFPESTYHGSVPGIPPGTIFYVGGLPQGMLAAGPAPRSRYSADLSVSMRGDRPPDRPTVIPAAPIGGGAGIWTDEEQRQRTVSALLDRAATGR